MKTDSLTLNPKSFKSRFISLLLSVMVLFMCVPAQDLTLVSAEDSTIATSMNVEFTDSKYNAIDSVSSGELFYILLTLGGANVTETGQNTDVYRFYVPNELQLVNFPNNGFTEGAEYHGFVVHIEGDVRYLEYSQDNGDTQVMTLQGKFANGITPNDTKYTFDLVYSGDGTKVSNTMVTKSASNWSTSKTADKYTINAKDINDGVNIAYTLNANSNGSKKGNWYMKKLYFTDTITLPSNLTFTDSIRDAISIEGATIENVTISGNTATVKWSVESSNTKNELPNQSFKMNVTLNSNTVAGELEKSDDIVNTLAVKGQRVGEDDASYTLPDASAKVKVNALEPKFEINKTVDKSLCNTGDTVNYTVTVKNTGGKYGNVTVTDSIPSYLEDAQVGSTIPDSYGSATIVDNVLTANLVRVPAGGTVTIKYSAKIKSGASGTISNTAVATKDNTYYGSSTANVTVKTPKLTISKNGHVEYDGQNIGSIYYTNTQNQKAIFTMGI